MGISPIEIVDGVDNMNFFQVTQMLSRAQWCPDIKYDEVVKGAENSALVVGAFHASDQVGYARVVSDKTRFAYILDVFVHENFRNQGIAQKMIRHILGHDSLSDVYQWHLRTVEAHSLYKKLGFIPLDNASEWMGIVKKRPQRQPHVDARL